MVYNIFTDQVIMFGGYANQPISKRFNDIWVFNHSEEWQSVPYQTSSTPQTSSHYLTSSKSSTTFSSTERKTTTSTEISSPLAINGISSFYLIPVFFALAIIIKCKKRN